MSYDPNKIKTYLEGEQAYKENCKETACPYTFDSVEGKLWLQGYNGVKRIVEAYNNPHHYNMEKS